MGHCGSGEGILYSLRKDKHPHLTGDVDRGSLIQLRGRANTKPKAEYHSYIVDFLLNDEVGISELVGGLQDAMEVALQQFQARCEIDNQAGDLQLVCNKDALISSLMNLINNALESGEYPIEILIRLSVEKQQLKIQVMDNGPGLSPSQKQHMMEPFYTTKSNGTGLGLAVVQAVVRAHRGEFTLADSDLGGLSAELCLPLIRKPSFQS